MIGRESDRLQESKIIMFALKTKYLYYLLEFLLPKGKLNLVFLSNEMSARQNLISFLIFHKSSWSVLDPFW